ncbi:MAG: DUF5362 family protein [candidate division WOR-3 bacterium]
MRTKKELEQKLSTSCKEMSGWIKFLAIFWIVSGGVYAMTIVGAVIAWIQIWIGIILLRISKSCKAVTEGGFESLGDMFSSLKTFFVLNGVFTIIIIFLSILWAIIFGFTIIGRFLRETGGLY